MSDSQSGPPSRPDRRAERGESTRAALVTAARELFSERGYRAVGTSEIVERAGVTRGALYHHFRDKRDLFRAVYEQAEREIVETTASKMSAIEDPWELLVGGIGSFFDACTDPALMQIGLVDGPAVLGWQEWREVGSRYALGLVTFGLQNAMDAGALRPADVRQLAHLIFGALGEAALLIANSDDPQAARQEAEATVLVLLEGLQA
ncbi:MAG TPA: TetR/AcrR family transcriptional regulator [Thermoleophilaceae bacterium]|nr:TetR/AcrR family transcriptional regulator [Thermoleophilaceae bacterium]